MFVGPFSSSLKRGPWSHQVTSKLWHYLSDSPQLPALYFAYVFLSRGKTVALKMFTAHRGMQLLLKKTVELS